MSKPKHTPGPWVVDPDSPNDISPADDLGLGIANVSNVDNIDGRWLFGDESKANAKLIAAAPDMIAALERAALQFRFYEQAHREKGTDESMRKAEVNAGLAYDIEQVIAKATA